MGMRVGYIVRQGNGRIKAATWYGAMSGTKASIYFSLKANFISNNFSLLFYGLYKKLEDLFILFSFAGSGREGAEGWEGVEGENERRSVE